MRAPQTNAALLVPLAVAALSAGPDRSWAAPGRPTASSEWGPGYGAEEAADGVAGQNDNYWQTVAGQDKGAWWQQDLGQPVSIEALAIAWARHEDLYVGPPARVVVQVSLTGANGSWRPVREIAADELPRDSVPYEPDRQWRYELPPSPPARFVRLMFPDGGQPGAKYPGYVCLGEVDVSAPGLAPRIVAVEGRFGRAEVHVSAPALVRLYLRGPDGKLTAQSLLARSGARPWATGGYTYVVGTDGARYESRLAEPESVEAPEEAGGSLLRLRGVKLSGGADTETVATEDWTLQAEGADLVWTVTRRWAQDCTFPLAGSPALFFSFDARRLGNSTTSTIWYDPLRLAAGSSDLYAVFRLPNRVSENHLQTVRDRDTWAIYKLWTSWHAPVDLRLAVEGGHLYRRGGYALLSEAGAVTGAGAVQQRRAGHVEEITLRIGPAASGATGYQLAVAVPDKPTEAALKDFYESVLNGGQINDQKGYDFGNETDGWYYAGSSWMNGFALGAGVPADGRLSARPYDAARAFRGKLAHILATLDEQGRAHFGYNQGGEWVDDNLNTIIGTRAYLLHTGDLPFVRQCLPPLERMLAYFAGRRNAQGLFWLDDVGAHWYYDAITTSGVNTYYNTFFYKAAQDLADMEAAAGRSARAERYRALAAEVKQAINSVLWKEDAPGGPRYIDWIDHQGNEVTYFCDLCQYPPITVGIASPEQGRQILATADARMKELEAEHGYQGFAGLSALWPVPAAYNPIDWQTFGVYMNGGSLLSQTYWEVMARARVGDAEGAYRRLQRFAQRAAETSWAGDNAFDMRGAPIGDSEPYLADMVVVPAALVNGILGIMPTWERLEVRPCLPAGWSEAEADVVYRGRRHHVAVRGNEVRVHPGETVIEMPLLFEMDTNLRAGLWGAATATSVEFGDGGCVALQRVYDDGGARGLWKLDEAEGPVVDAGPHDRHGSLAGRGVIRGVAGHSEPSRACSFDGRGWMSIPDDGSLAIGPAEGFTVQCWLRTQATDIRVMVGKPLHYCLYVKNRKLAAWLMQDGQQYREALGSRIAADGQWHHATAVFDRARQELSLYLDGTLDTPDGQPGPDNPVSIAPIGASTSRAELTLGSLGAGFPFVGSLDEVSVFSGALAPEQLSVTTDYPAPFGSRAVRYAQHGTYQSPPCDWGDRGFARDLTVAVDLNGGSVTATVETSINGFRTIQDHTTVPLRDGVHSYTLGALRAAARAVRVSFELRASRDATATPAVDGFRVTGQPVSHPPTEPSPASWRIGGRARPTAP